MVVDVSGVKLPGEAKQNNLPPECGQPIDAGDVIHLQLNIQRTQGTIGFIS
jgi:hypothetical protein